MSQISNSAPPEEGASGETHHRVSAAADIGRLRIDKFLADAVPDLTRARIQALIAEGRVRATGPESARTVGDASERVKPGTDYEITVPPPRPAAPQAQEIPLDVLYEDDALIVINKPAGLVVHPAAGNHDETLVNALLAHCKGSLSGIGGVERPGIVHRLDKDTSGVMVAAKTDAAHQKLSAQFAAHGADGALERAYLAIAWGAPRLMSFTIDAPLGRHPGDRKKQAVRKEGQPGVREAVTHVTTRARYGDPEKPVACLLECRLETGRTHQIRVHLAHTGHPVVGDPTYGRAQATRMNALPEEVRDAAKALNRQALHAYLLGFNHPQTGDHMQFTAPLPSDMSGLIDKLERFQYKS